MKNGFIVDHFGTKTHYANNIVHREDGPAIEYADGTKIYVFNGKYHREDGPAVEWLSGTKFWYKNGKLHRNDGPAVELVKGKGDQWYYNGDYIYCTSQQEFEQKLLELIFT
jgi:hypothetical protein